MQLVTQRGSELARRTAVEGVPLVPAAWAVNLDPRAFWSLRRLIGSFRPDLVHAHDSPALTLSRLAIRTVGGGRPPRLVATRRVDFHVARRSAWRRADHLVAVSDAVRRVLVADGFARERLTVVRDGVDPDEVRREARHPLDIRQRLGLAADTPLAVNVAALVEHKDQATLVRAAAIARRGRPDLHWVIAGTGNRRGALEHEIQAAGLTDRVHLLGYIEEASALIREANVFVMSSKEEGLGSVVLHALVLGTPVVATAAGGLPEVLPAAALVPVGDAAALARRVAAELDHPSPIPLPPQFTAAAMAGAVVALYRSLT